ncbi:Fre8 [Kluyveromyces lactis]|nr:Fre8 [Kluyveromyces lactis]
MRSWLFEFWHWLESHSPSFDVGTEKPIRLRLVRQSGLAVLIISIVIILLFIPLMNYLKLRPFFFKLEHRLRHHTFKRVSWIHRSRIYHNEALQIAVFWGVITFAFVLYDCNNDLVLITKRLGRIPVSLMPALLFLTTRPSPLPHVLYLALLPLHKWISRIVVFQSLLHTILYTVYYARIGALAKLKKLANIWGILAMLLFIMIAITSLPKIRRVNFQLFYFVHYAATWLSVVMLQYHARPNMNMISTFNIILLLGQIIYRLWNTRLSTISVIPVSPAISVVEFPLADLSKKPILPSGHVRMNNYHSFWLKRWFYHLIPLQHPFTIASLPNESMVRLIVRTGKFPLKTNSKYYITGTFEPKVDFMSKSDSRDNNRLLPFQSATPMLLLSPLSFNINAKRVFMVVGGSAISFGLPMLRILNFNGVTVKLIWITRDHRDMKILNVFKNNYNGLEIFVTGTLGAEQDLQIDYVDYGPDPLGLPDPELQESVPQALPSSSDYNPETTLTSSSYPKYGSISTDKSAFSSDLDHSQKHNEDEFDFTNVYSATNTLKRKKSEPKLFGPPSPFHKDEAFRKPKVIIPPNDENYKSDVESLEDDDMKLTIPAGVKLVFGRPQLSNLDYQWCLQKECSLPSEVDDCCVMNSDVNITHVDDLANVWVVAAGPKGLVESTKRWATDGGLHFHEESFSV